MTEQRVDWLTVAGLGLLLMPLLTMWHEIGGHSAMCVALGHHVLAIGAFYMNCDSTGLDQQLVALAGASIDSVLCLVAWLAWRRAKGDFARLLLWLIATTKGFVAAGYLLFSGVTGLGDLGPGEGGGIGPLPYPWLWRIGFTILGGLIYWRLALASGRALVAMLGDAPETQRTRKRIAHVYYAAQGVAAFAVGLLNPVGLFVLLASAAASTFGGNAGLISIGYYTPRGDTLQRFVIARSWPVILLGAGATLAFALVLGPSIRFGG